MQNPPKAKSTISGATSTDLPCCTMGPDSSIGSMIPHMTTMKDTMKLYTQMVVSGTRAANDMKSQL